MKRFTSSLVSISFFRDQLFLVPSYQRPYVWADQEINKLLTDIWAAFNRRDQTYYLGTVVTSRNGLTEELIDGQQRFTTLWLFALAFFKLAVPSELQHFLKGGEQIRLRFAIRTEVQDYLKQLLSGGADSSLFDPPPSLLNEHPYLKGIAYAAKHIYRAIPQLRLENGAVPSPVAVSAFADYIAVRVLFVKNTAPPGADLKKLFTTLNNSGIQLEQTDILKSRLLDQLSTDQLLYSKVWEACAFMENYFERNVQSSFSISAKELNPELLAHFVPAAFQAKDNLKEKLPAAISLSDIINRPMRLAEPGLLKTAQGRDVACESIIDFPQLLLHTLRLYRKKCGQPDFKQPFQAGRLLEIFEPLCAAPENEITGFFAYLWEVRFLFDLHLVKWVEKDGERILGLRGLNSELQRDPVTDKTEAVMLQSLLYFTGNYNTQMWLSAWLQELLDGRTGTAQLEAIDNSLSLTFMPDKQATWQWLTHRQLPENLDYQTYLEERNGTGFRHYWFYKLEYVIWKNWEKRSERQFQSYRITSKNSVEHIFPQHEEFGAVLLDNEGRPFGDSFANLTLLSVGQNSGYGHRHIGKKRIDFDKKDSYDSLKLARFFSVCADEPTYEQLKQHYDEMIGALNRHYAKPLEPALLLSILNPGAG